MDFLKNESYTEKDLNALISNHLEESINLDYKRGGALEKTENKKKEIAKDVSSFANSIGGVIIYGIEEENHIPKGFKFVDGNEFTKEWLEHVIQSRISRKIDGIQIHPVRLNNDPKKSVYIVKIPESPRAPHMASDNRYYKRYNFESVAMEDYEVRDLLLKKKKTILEVSKPILNNSKGKAISISQVSNGNYKLWFHGLNIGQTLERDFKLEISIPNRIFLRNLSGHERISSKCLNNHITFEKSEHTIISIAGTQTIFPQENYQFGFVSIKLSNLDHDSTVAIKAKLYYSAGIDKKTWEITEL